MIRKRFQEAKTVFLEWDLRSAIGEIDESREVLEESWIGQRGSLLLEASWQGSTTYTLIGVAWLYNKTSPFGWWTLKPRSKADKDLAHLYERPEFPYPGDEEAMEGFIAKGGMIGTAIGPKGMLDFDKDSYNYQNELQNKKLKQEAQKLWFKMRNEVISELQEKGYDVE